MDDIELKKQIIADAQPLIDKINTLKKEVGEAEDKEEKEKNEPSAHIREWIEDKKIGRFKGKSLVTGEED